MSETPAGVPVCYRHPERESHIRCQRCERPICPDCMTEAAVGFQCPGCVAEGRRTTRSGQAAYGGAISANPATTSIALIVLNAAVWIAIQATGGWGSNLSTTLAIRPWDVINGEVWQIVTSGFTHIAVWHLGVNMMVLWFIGPTLEQVLGRLRFLAVYFCSLLAGSVSVLWLSPLGGFTVGASGAIFGMLGALLVLVIKRGGELQTLLIWLGINAFITFTVPNVSWQGHLGGFLGGAAVTALLVLAPRSRRPLVQWGGISVLLGALLVATVLRSLTF